MSTIYMASIVQLIQTIFLPLWYFLILAMIYAISKLITLFFVAGGRIKSYYSIENYWVYLIIILLCAVVGVVGGYGNWIIFCRWFLSSLFAAFLGMYFGFDKGINLSEEDLQELDSEIDDEI